VKLSQYGVPPRKPSAPALRTGPAAEDIRIAASPGVEAPDGREPAGDLSEDLPRAIADDPGGLADEPERVAADTSSGQEKSITGTVGPSTLDPVAVVGNFFKSIVDLVTPASDPVSPEPREELATSEPQPSPGESRPQAVTGRGARPAPAQREMAGDEVDLMADEQIEAVPDALAESLETPAESSADLQDALMPSEPDGAADLEDLAELPAPPASVSGDSASARTLDRIKSLLGDAPKEDEFGLPSVDIPTRERIDEADAADTVLDQLVDSAEPPTGFLDDPPGRETGPSRQPIEDDRVQVPVSDALQARLRRLGDAVSREITVDTKEILRQGRSQTIDPSQSSEVRATAPRRMTPRRSDQVTDDILRTDNQITRQKTPADRFAERLERIRQMEQEREQQNKSVDPALGPKSEAVGGPADSGDAVVAAAAEEPVAAEEPAILDRMIGFFGGAQTQPSAVKPEKRDSQAPDYRGAPSTRQLPAAEPAPDIENLEAFDQPDETKPVQAPGSLEPVFLDRLAGLFNEEEAAQAQGWKAEVETENPFPGRGQPAQSGAAIGPWTTTVEINAGEGKAPVVIQVAQTPTAGAGATTGDAMANAQEPMMASPSRQSGGKQTLMAKEAYGDPLRQPDQKIAETQQKTFFGRLTKLFQPKDPVALERESLLLEPDEKLATARDALDGGIKVASRTQGEPQNYWPITRLTKADPLVSPPRRPTALTRTSLSDVTLTLGESVNLENIFPPGQNGSDPNNQCVKKNRGTTLFCIEPVDWPADMLPTFQVTTILYTGSMAIVRYDQAAATRLHTLFRSDDYDKVVAWYQNRFGEPTEVLKRSIAPLAKPRQDNPTVSWRSLDQITNAITVIEIRKFDDTRGGFPDTGRGTVMLYYTTSPSIFPQVSSHELMRLKRIGDITQTEADKTASEAKAAGEAKAASEALTEPPPGGTAVSEDELFGSEPVLQDTGLFPSDTALDGLPGNAPDQAPTGLFERPEDILSEPDLLGPVLTEPEMLAPEPPLAGSNRRELLFEEPVTDEPPDQIIEILPTRTGNRS